MFGIPSKRLHDRGVEFENDLFKDLANVLGIQNLRITPYHPQTYGITEKCAKKVEVRTMPRYS